MRRRLGSVRVRTTLAATVLTALVLTGGSIAIVRVVEDDLLEAAGDPFHEALEEAGHDDDEQVRLVALDTARGPLVLVLAPSSTAGLVEAVVIDEDSEARGSFSFDPADGSIVDGSLRGSLAAAFGPDVLTGLRAEGTGDAAVRDLLAGAALAEVREGVDAVRDALVLVVPALVVLLALTTWFVVGRALRPVAAISERVSTIRTSTLDERVPVPDSDDEIAELARLMNGMLDRLEEGSLRQRRFVADASHELRSPLATIMAAAEIAQASPEPARLAGLADELAVESRRMDRLITDLLDLARLDEDGIDRAADRFELEPLIASAIAEVDHDGVDVVTDVPGSVTVEGSPAALERAIANLVRNAVQHARGRVAISARADSATVRIIVDDDGPGVPPAERERIFERFVRLDASRQRGTGGAGIGLAIVRAIAERHGGSVTVGEAPSLGGARFELALPIDRPPAGAAPRALT